MGMRPGYSIDELKKYCTEAANRNDLCKKLGIVRLQKNHYRDIKKYNIDISHFKNPKWQKTKYKVGAKIGDFEILEVFTKPRSNYHGSLRFYCKCKCKCGNIVLHESNYYKRYKCCDICGLTEVRANNSKYYKGLPILYFKHLKSRAKTKKLEFNLTKEYCWELFEKQNGRCAISNIPLILEEDGVRCTASLDRIDSNKGYIKGNVQWLFSLINIMKSIMSDDDFIYICQLVGKSNTIDNNKISQIWDKFRNSTFNKRKKIVL